MAQLLMFTLSLQCKCWGRIFQKYNTMKLEGVKMLAEVQGECVSEKKLNFRLPR